MATQALPELESQYRAMRERSGLLDRSGRGKLDIAGPDAVEYLQGQVTNDIESLEPGQGCYAALLTPKGKIIADMRVLLRRPTELWLDTEGPTLDALRSKLELYRIGRDAELADRSRERAILALIGPGAEEACGVKPPDLEHSFVEGRVDASAVVAVRTNLGLDLVLDGEALEQVRSVLTDRGAVPVGEEAAELLRIESGRPRHGLDMSDDNLPGEVGLEQRAVSFTKGCYVGQEPVARMHYRGHPNRCLRGLRLSEPAAAGSPVFAADGKDVGRLTSACVSPSLGPIALAIIRREVEPRGQVRVGAAGSSATVVELPFEQR